MNGKTTSAEAETGALRVGVIGLGMGRKHIQGWREHPKARVVAIADLDPERLQAVGDEFRIEQRYAHPDNLLAREPLDAVSICTPNKFHKELTLAAFGAGCHVLCEKPMAMNAAEGREMLAASRQARRRLMINFSFRFTAQSQALKAQVDAGVFGEFYFGRSTWHRRRGMPNFGGWFGQKELAGGGPLIDLGVHRLDLALWLMGYPQPEWVMGSTYNALAGPLAAQAGKDFDVEDLAAGFIRFKNGATLVLEASWAAHIAEAELMETRLLGPQAGLVQRNVDEGYSFSADIYLDRSGAPFDLHMHTPPTPAKSAMYHFADAILHERPHDATGEQGLIVMEILDAIYESARTGVPVRIGG